MEPTVLSIIKDTNDVKADQYKRYDKNQYTPIWFYLLKAHNCFLYEHENVYLGWKSHIPFHDGGTLESETKTWMSTTNWNNVSSGLYLWEKRKSWVKFVSATTNNELRQILSLYDLTRF